MTNEYGAITDGTFTLQETDNENQFYFYRNDGGEVLDDADREMMDLYHVYIMHKMMTGEITGMVMNNICAERSDDGKCVRLTVSNMDVEKAREDDSTVSDNQPSFLKRLLQKIFG